MKKNSCLILIFMLFSWVLTAQSSWDKAISESKAEVVVFYYDSDHFISNKNGNIEGIEYDLLQNFFSFVRKNYNIKLKVNFVKTNSFAELYQKIKEGKPGVFGACSFSITESRKKEIQFSPKYMPDVEVLICSGNIPLTDDTATFINYFSKAKALSVANTTFDEDIEKLKSIIPNLEVEYVPYASDIRKRLASKPNLFSYIELPNYILALKNGVSLKRQSLFKVERPGYAFIFPLSSDWNEPVEVFFNNPSFRITMNSILKKHLGNDTKELLWEMSDKKNNQEINLLTKEREIQRLEIEKKQLELNKHKLVKNISFVAIVAFVVIVILLYNRSRARKKTNEILHQQNQKIIIQKQIIEDKNKDIIDSLTYAKRIQKAILPPVDILNSHLKNGFVLYTPKDIVAGDFYWLEHKNDNILFATADCTGHGVPGAMVSVVCNNALNRAVREYGLTNPAEILNKTREIVIQEFEKSEEDVKDGMDIALCGLRFVPPQTSQREGVGLRLKNKDTIALLQYAGANNPLWIVRSDELIEVKPNKQPIGKTDNPQPFTAHTIELQKEDTIYLFTDGFADQFGGEKGKKFMYKPFKELLLSIQEKTMDEQKIMLEQHFENWKGSLEQVDDVCIIGVKI